MPLGILAWHLAHHANLRVEAEAAARNRIFMSKYIVTVSEIFPANTVEAASGAATSVQEVFKLGIDEFDPLTFCAALKQKTRGRKPAVRKEEKT